MPPIIIASIETPTGTLTQATPEHARQAGASEAQIVAALSAQAWQALRQERARRLSACDWTVLPDSPLTAQQRAAWEAYRTALRELPATLEAAGADPAAALADPAAWPVRPA